MKFLLKVIGIIFLIGIISSLVMGNDHQSNKNTNNQSEDSNATSTEKTKSVLQAQNNWTYDNKKDEMRNIETKYATNESLNELDLGFPYSHEKLSILLRKKGNEASDIILEQDAQFNCHITEACIVKVKFDDGPIENFTVVGNDSGNNRSVFIDKSNLFLSKLKKSKMVIMEIPVFDKGSLQFKFDVSNLAWNN